MIWLNYIYCLTVHLSITSEQTTSKHSGLNDTMLLSLLALRGFCLVSLVWWLSSKDPLLCTLTHLVPLCFFLWPPLRRVAWTILYGGSGAKRQRAGPACPLKGQGHSGHNITFAMFCWQEKIPRGGGTDATSWWGIGTGKELKVPKLLISPASPCFSPQTSSSFWFLSFNLLTV